MTDQTDDLTDVPSIRGSRNDAILLAIGETRAAAKSAAESAARVESAIGGLAARVGKLEIDVARLQATLSSEHDADSARREAEKTQAVTKTSPATWIALTISTLAVVVTVVLDAYHF
jgi:hypothetical protein